MPVATRGADGFRTFGAPEQPAAFDLGAFLLGGLSIADPVIVVAHQRHITMDRSGDVGREHLRIDLHRDRPPRLGEQTRAEQNKITIAACGVGFIPNAGSPDPDGSLHTGV